MHITQKHKDVAAEVHAYDYLTGKGIQLEKKGRYYQHPVHDSLQINADGRWYWNSRQVGGQGAISLARELYNFGYLEAVKDVLNTTQNLTPTDFSKHVKKDFEYPSYYETKDVADIYSYLNGKRGIDRSLIQLLIDKGLIVQDKLKNIVFKWYENGKVVGANLQGTSSMPNGGYFKKIMDNSKEDGGFSFDIGIPKKIGFFESVIDGLSYVQLKKEKDIRIVSMAGLKQQVVMNHLKQFLTENANLKISIEQIIFGVDNDKGGKNFLTQWENFISEDLLKIDIPLEDGWDWNEVLIEFNKKKEIHMERM